MRTFIIVLSSILTIAATIPYVLEIVHGKTKPRVVSWFAWAAVLMIGAVASFTQHQLPAAVYSFSCGIECALVVVLGLRYGSREFSKLDIASLIGVGTGLVTLILFKSPSIAVAVSIATDFAGSVPTLKHSWSKPYEESWLAFALYGLGSGLALLIADFHVFTAVAYPVYLFILDISLTVFVVTGPQRGFAKWLDPSSKPSIGAFTHLPASPDPPARLASALRRQTIFLSWLPVEGDDPYAVYRNGARIAISNVPAFIDHSPPSEGNVEYYVTVVGSSGESLPSTTEILSIKATRP